MLSFRYQIFFFFRQTAQLFLLLLAILFYLFANFIPFRLAVFHALFMFLLLLFRWYCYLRRCDRLYLRLCRSRYLRRNLHIGKNIMFNLQFFRYSSIFCCGCRIFCCGGSIFCCGGSIFCYGGSIFCRLELCLQLLFLGGRILFLRLRQNIFARILRLHRQYNGLHLMQSPAPKITLGFPGLRIPSFIVFLLLCHDSPPSDRI